MATVSELHAVLTQLVERGMGDNELRLAIQPSWPLSYHVSGIWFDEESDEEPQEGSDVESDEDLDPHATQVFIVSGHQDYDNPYAPKRAFLEDTLQL